MSIFVNMAKRFFARDEDGGSTVEFMLMLPLITFWFAGSYAFFDAYAESTRSVKATYTVADILSRQTDDVDSDYLDGMNNLFANFIGKSSNDTWVRISSITQVDDELTIEWSHATGLHDALISDDEIPEEIVPTLLDDEAVILIETYSEFIPVVGDFFQHGDRHSAFGMLLLESRTQANKVALATRFLPKLGFDDG